MPDHAPGAMTSSRRAIASAGERTGPAPRLALGFDFGTRRIGVAVGSELTGAARPLCVIDAAPRRQWEAILALIEQWQPGVLVVGIARHPDGAGHEMTARCERFARQLQGRSGLAVARVDERYSSAVVGAERARDQDAAAVILQQWFDEGARR
jgi:putative holliday junction resolvase